MRLFSSFFSACMLLGAALAKTKSASERFDEFHALARAGSPLKLTEKSFKSLTATPRDYSVAVLLTAMESRVGCQLCKDFQPEWDLLGKSWTQGDRKGDSRLLLGTLDFADGREIFVSLGLQSVPVLVLYPPTDGPHAVASKEPLRYDFASGPIAEQVHAWLSAQLPDRPHPAVQRPIDWMKWATKITIGVGSITFAAVAWPYMLPVLQSRNIWASVSLISILLFTSGHMFNHIRNVPYVAGDGHGGISYFAGGFQTQYGLETQIIAALYGFMTFCAICLATKVPRMTDAKTQGAAVLIWTVVLFLFYSFLLSVFRIKNSGYPFSLPPFL